MVFRCRICGEDSEEGKNNRFYCSKCREVMKGTSSHWELSKNIHIWIKNNKPTRTVIDGKNIKPIFIGREVVY